MKIGINIYCSRKHSNLGRRRNVSKKQLREEKAWYDLFIRESMTEEEKELKRLQKAFLFQIDYSANPEKYKKERERRMPAHIEYCRNPKYKEYKHRYDVERHHKAMYGDFWEASIILTQLEKEIDARMANQQQGTYNKSQKRKRSWQKLQAKTNLNSLLSI